MRSKSVILLAVDGAHETEELARKVFERSSLQSETNGTMRELSHS